MDLYDRVVEALDEYGILYGDVVDNGDGTINIVGVDESEWDDVVMAIEDLLGLEVEVPPEDHEEFDDELIVRESLKEAEQDKELKWFVILGTKHSSSEVVEGFKTKEEALKALTKHLEEEPENIIFYTIRKEVPTKMFDYEW